MKLSRTFAALIGLGLLISAAPSHAATRRTFVSTTGSDANFCDPLNPCRSFGVALNNTVSGGEVIVLDSGGYGGFVVSGKSFSIIAPPGVYAGVSILSGVGIDVSMASSQKVTLEGLSVNGLGGTKGVRFTGGGAASSVVINRLSVTGFSEEGVLGAANALYQIDDSRFFRNTGGNVVLDTTIGSVLQINAVINDSEFNSGAHGVFIQGAVKASVVNCRAANNSFAGFAANGSTSFALLRIERSTGAFNSTGVQATDAAIFASNSSFEFNSTGASSGSFGSIRMSGTWVSRNVIGLDNVAGGTYTSHGGNVVISNTTTNGAFDATVPPQ